MTTRLGLNVQAGTVNLGKTNTSSSPDVHAVGGAGITGIDPGAVVRYTGTGNYQVYSGSTIALTGGTLDLNGHNQNGTALTISTAGSTLANTATGTTSTYSPNTITMNSDFTVDGSGNIALVGVITPHTERTLTKNGTGTLALTSDGDYDGLCLTANAGTVVLNKASGISPH